MQLARCIQGEPEVPKKVLFAKFLSAIDHLDYHPTLGKKKNKKDKVEITHSKRFLQTGTYEPK